MLCSIIQCFHLFWGFVRVYVCVCMYGLWLMCFPSTICVIIKKSFPPLLSLSSFAVNYMSLNLWLYFWYLNFIPLDSSQSESLLLAGHGFYLHNSIVKFKIRNCNIAHVLFPQNDFCFYKVFYISIQNLKIFYLCLWKVMYFDKDYIEFNLLWVGWPF